MSASPPLRPVVANEGLFLPSGARRLTDARALSDDARALLLVFAATAAGGLIRFFFAARGSFPTGDGGMFLAMIEDVRRAHFALPAFTSYNGGDIPFAYPPLPFYMAAGIADVLGLSSLTVLQLLPPLIATLTVPAFYLLARDFLPRRSMALLATALFAITPGTFAWQVLGGGLTRSFGFLFALLALHFLYRLTKEPNGRRAAAAVFFASLTLLCHPEMASFVATSYAVILCVFGRNRRSISWAAAVTALAALLTLPWWGLIVYRHGADTFLAAFQTGNSSILLAPLQAMSFGFTQEPFLPLVAALGFGGLIALIFARRYFLPALFLTTVAFDTHGAAPPAAALCLLAAYASIELAGPALKTMLAIERPGPAFAGGGFVMVLLALLVWQVPLDPTVSASPLHVLPAGQREAMEWAAANTPEDSRFLVVSGEPFWSLDITSEWFPALAGRPSLATAQGSEWLKSNRGFKNVAQRHIDLAKCEQETADCLTKWSVATGLTYRYVYVVKPPAVKDGRLVRDRPAALRNSLTSAPDYRLVFDGTGAQVFELQPEVAGSAQ